MAEPEVIDVEAEEISPTDTSHALAQPSAAECQRAYERYNLFLAHRTDAIRSFLLMGGDLLHFYETELWRAMGFDTFGAFATAPIKSGGCGMESYRATMRYVAIHRRYVRELRVPEKDLVECGVYKLDVLMPHVNEDNAREQVEMAKTQSREDLEATLRNRPDPPLPTRVVARPIRLWPFPDAPADFQALFSDEKLGEGKGATEDCWIAHFPPEHAGIPLERIGTTHRDLGTKSTLRDHSLAFLYRG